MNGVVVIGADETRAALDFGRLIEAVRDAFASGAQVPLRHHHAMPQPDGTTAVLLLMPAWQDQGYLGVKIASIYPGNNRRGLPGVYSTYLLSDAGSGRPLALIDGDQITARRTAAVAALAASYLAAPEARSLLVVGAGRVASLIAPALREVRPIRAVTVWDIDPAKARALAAALGEQGFEARAEAGLEQAAREADVISCATLSTEPLIRGEWLKPGVHLDLIGSFTPQMREADDAAMARGRVFVDSRDALTESGDLIAPLDGGALPEIAGTLADLCSGAVGGRRTADEITVFKAVGTALSDIAAAALAYGTPRGAPA